MWIGTRRPEAECKSYFDASYETGIIRTMALIVNGEKIEDSLIQQEVKHLRPDYERVFAEQDPEEREAQLLDWSRENVIESVLINQQAKKTCRPIPEAEIEAALTELKEQYEGQKLPEELDGENDKGIKQNIELKLRIERMFRRVCEDIPEPSKEDILKFYGEDKEQLKSAEQVRVSHIVKHINWQTNEATALDEMGRVQDELEKGAIFETLVTKYSDCPESGGDLGYITRGQMVEEFEDVAFNLGPGEVSEIFHTRFGFHIVKLYDRKPAVVPGLEEVRGRIVNELKGQMRRKAIEDFVDRLRSRAKIVIGE